eukprot:6137248-Prymnesium_polylepis.1
MSELLVPRLVRQGDQRSCSTCDSANSAEGVDGQVRHAPGGLRGLYVAARGRRCCRAGARPGDELARPDEDVEGGAAVRLLDPARQCHRPPLPPRVTGPGAEGAEGDGQDPPGDRDRGGGGRVRGGGDQGVAASGQEAGIPGEVGGLGGGDEHLGACAAHQLGPARPVRGGGAGASRAAAAARVLAQARRWLRTGALVGGSGEARRGAPDDLDGLRQRE